jgi:hypothetical protein
MPATRLATGNPLFDTLIYIPAVAVPNLPASSTAQQTVTIQGINLGDLFSWNQQSNVAGVAIENIQATGPNTTVWTWSNATVGAINGTAAQPVLLEVVRCENTVDGGLSALPSFIF